MKIDKIYLMLAELRDDIDFLRREAKAEEEDLIGTTHEINGFEVTFAKSAFDEEYAKISYNLPYNVFPSNIESDDDEFRYSYHIYMDDSDEYDDA